MNLLTTLSKTPIQRTRPRITCKDGTSLSVQASEYVYCTPRVNNAKLYTHVEVGFPSIAPTEALARYAEDPDDLLGTVYLYVPVEIVEAFIEEHGGIAK